MKGKIDNLKALLSNTSSDRMSTMVAFLEKNRVATDTGKLL